MERFYSDGVLSEKQQLIVCKPDGCEYFCPVTK